MNRKIKILYIINSFKKGGPVNMLHNLVKSIDKEKFHITVLAIKPCSKSISKDFSDIKCELIELNNSSDILNGIMKNYISKLKPDIIHSHGGNADFFNAKMKGNYIKFSTVHCTPDEDFIMKKGKIIGTIKANLFIKNLKKIDVPIACSETVSNKIMEKRKMSIGYVRNGILKPQMHNKTKGITRKELKIEEGKIVIVFCGYLSKRKNVNMIFDALERVRRNDICFLVLGNGDYYETLRNRAKKDQRIKMIGRVDNAIEYLNISNYIISASFSEGLPLAVLEGMSCGLPAILSNIDSHAEVHKLAPRAVTLFDNNSVDKLALQISNLSNEHYTSKADAARNLVEELLNSDLMAIQYQEKYIQKIQESNSYS